ncbi:MAG: hypothetical protein HXY20_02780 [Acidobacteria bacterium]|nr:hypothetical protein [Acidobacteriota bacterium]
MLKVAMQAMTSAHAGFRRVAAGILALCIVGGVSAAVHAVVQEDAARQLLETADEIVQQVAKIRGLVPKAPINKGVKTKEEISEYLVRSVSKHYDEKELSREGKLLEKAGFIPDGSQYKDLVMRLLTEQVGGYYDPDEKTFFIAGWLPMEQQRPVMVHELTHALQDQHFDLGRLLDEDARLKNDDRALARKAVFEGDGMAVMLDYLLQPMGKTFLQLPDLVFVMRSQFTLMDSQFAVFRDAPMFLKETLLFPYGYGAAFLQKVRAGDQPWSSVDKIYGDLPESTEQIIHAEKYLTIRDSPAPLPEEDVARTFGERWRKGYENVFGEFSLFLLLKIHLGEERSKRAAAGWDGDRVRLVEDVSGDRSFVLLESVWDTEDEAEEFHQALEDWLPRRFPEAEKLAPADGSSQGVTYSRDAGLSFAQRRGAKVRLVLDIPRETASRLGP